MRTLTLTTPYMHGPDVKSLQTAINAWRKQQTVYPHTPIQPDSQFGPLTRHAMNLTAFQMGLDHGDGRPGVQEQIEHPDKRSRSELARAKQRLDAAKKHGQGLAAIAKHASEFIGVHENPPNSNRGQPNPSGWEQHFGIDGAPWCGAFAGSMLLAAGGHPSARVVYCPYIVQDAKAGVSGFAKWHPRGDEKNAKPGCFVLYDWNGDGVADHVGIVRGFSGGNVGTIEGNTSKQNDPTGSQSDGGIVAARSRAINSTVMGYAEPRF
jgi:hypothetical protein